MKKQYFRRGLTVLTAAVMLGTAVPQTKLYGTAASNDISDQMTWDALRIGGGGFVSGIVTGKKEMYARTDVGGAYRYNYEQERWEQLLGFINDADRGLLSVDAMAVDPTDDKTVYFLCGCAYFSNEKTVIFKTTDGGKTMKEIDVTHLIKVMGNGDGRQCGESIAVDPDNPKVIYAGGDVTSDENSVSALIKSTDGGETWAPVEGYDKLGMFDKTVKWPTWTDKIARCTMAGAYNNQNGVAAIAITGGKVYVATSAAGTNVHVASVKDDKFSVLSKDLPTGNLPSRINVDANGDLLISYIAGLAFNGTAGGAYRFSPKTGTVTELLEPTAGFGSVWADPANPDHMIAGTCGSWKDQEWEPWTEEHGPAWGDQYYRSFDGGKTWENFTPGKTKGWEQPLISDYLQDGGYAWIRDKAIHWSGTVVTDPRNADRMFITSGNGVFIAENIWSTDENKLPTFTFHPDGIEEVVSLDFVSTPDGLDLSAIGDYDGFIHESPDKVGLQYQPNMGSTSAIAVCPQDTNVWVRTAEGDTNNTASAFYTTDRGKTWNGMTPAFKGGKCAIAMLGKGKYRIFNSAKDSGDVSYSDDFGKTWNKCEGIPSQYGSKSTMLLVEPEDPNTVYAYATYFNSSWHYSKDEPDATDAQYKFCVSTDGGLTFTSTDICMYDQCDSAGRIGYLGKNHLMLGGGWYGMYVVDVDITTAGTRCLVNTKDVYYCKTLGYGAPEKKGGPNTIYFYGKPKETDPEGIYRSTDEGSTWVCINTDHLYGGTGNGNYLVGDMNEFGKVYMSTVGCGIICGQLKDSSSQPGSTTSKTTTTETTTTTVSGEETKTVWGDVDCDGKVLIADCVLLARYLAEDTVTVTMQGLVNAHVTGSETLTTEDNAKIMQYLAGVLTKEQLAPSGT